jgi:ATP-binding cassette, subfamily C (CFTR/MRP), member 1
VDFDKVVVLQDGRVVEFDNPRALLERDSEFRNVWRLQDSE